LLVTHLHPLAQTKQLEPLPLREVFKECKTKFLSSRLSRISDPVVAPLTAHPQQKQP
jgi:hypothetical protein